MSLFILGLVLGGLSGGGTYAFTDDGQLGLLVGAIAAALTWLGLATIILADD